MFKKYILWVMFFISLLVTSFAHAYSDYEVGKWFQDVLVDTFTASYRDTPAEIYAVQKKFSQAAWEPMNSFFAQELQIIQEHQLSLHPQLLNKPSVVGKGNYMGSESWRVDQSFNIPELHMSIECSALIISVTTPKKASFLIQSIDMKVLRY